CTWITPEEKKVVLKTTCQAKSGRKATCDATKTKFPNECAKTSKEPEQKYRLKSLINILSTLLITMKRILLMTQDEQNLLQNVDSDWFDMTCFHDCIRSVVISFCSKVEGRKALIGDNLSSHLSCETIPKDNDNTKGDEPGPLVCDAFVEYLKNMRYGGQEDTVRKRKKKINAKAGKGVSVENFVVNTFESENSATDNREEHGSDDDDLNDVPDDDDELENLPPPCVDSNFVSSDAYVIESNENEEPMEITGNSKKSGGKDFIGLVQEVSSDGRALFATFVRPKSSRDFNGFVYGFPNVKDECSVTFDQVRKVLTGPERYGRGYFNQK
ncbi:hypothetical protein Bhyg_02970, partial [Pseudolycoriella hygida]